MAVKLGLPLALLLLWPLLLALTVEELTTEAELLPERSWLGEALLLPEPVPCSTGLLVGLPEELAQAVGAGLRLMLMLTVGLAVPSATEPVLLTEAVLEMQELGLPVEATLLLGLPEPAALTLPAALKQWLAVPEGDPEKLGLPLLLVLRLPLALPLTLPLLLAEAEGLPEAEGDGLLCLLAEPLRV